MLEAMPSAAFAAAALGVRMVAADIMTFSGQERDGRRHRHP
jgi:hypothetical protein